MTQYRKPALASLLRTRTHNVLAMHWMEWEDMMMRSMEVKKKFLPLKTMPI